MRVGILTFHAGCNFGANLQALATQTALLDRGIDAVVLDYRIPDRVAFMRSITPAAQVDCHQAFVSKYLRLSPPLTTPAEISAFCLDALDGLFIGSDAVFRVPPKLDARRLWWWLSGRSSGSFSLSCELEPHWLGWYGSDHRARGIGAATIAASAAGSPFFAFGLSQIRAIRSALRNFQFVSVRDDWTSWMLRILSTGQARPVFCPDPVFSLPDSLARDCLDEAPPVCVKDALCVSLRATTAWSEALKKAAESRGLRLVTLPNPEESFAMDAADSNVSRPLSPLQWFNSISHSAGYVGVRFHALVTAVRSAVPIATVARPRRFSLLQRQRCRHYDLCRRAGIEGAYYTERSISRCDPVNVIDQMFEPGLRKRMAEFSVRAQARFREVLDSVLTLWHSSLK